MRLDNWAERPRFLFFFFLFFYFFFVTRLQCLPRFLFLLLLLFIFFSSLLVSSAYLVSLGSHAFGQLGCDPIASATERVLSAVDRVLSAIDLVLSDIECVLSDACTYPTRTPLI